MSATLEKLDRPRRLHASSPGKETKVLAFPSGRAARSRERLVARARDIASVVIPPLLTLALMGVDADDTHHLEIAHTRRARHDGRPFRATQTCSSAEPTSNAVPEKSP